MNISTRKLWQLLTAAHARPRLSAATSRERAVTTPISTSAGKCSAETAAAGRMCSPMKKRFDVRSVSPLADARARSSVSTSRASVATRWPASEPRSRSAGPSTGAAAARDAAVEQACGEQNLLQRGPLRPARALLSPWTRGGGCRGGHRRERRGAIGNRLPVVRSSFTVRNRTVRSCLPVVRSPSVRSPCVRALGSRLRARHHQPAGRELSSGGSRHLRERLDAQPSAPRHEAALAHTLQHAARAHPRRRECEERNLALHVRRRLREDPALIYIM
ncbi:hypothetical protein T492DRAFT_951733 [Pavlovales sp. CCMP2436]|nr:hypothetical protein T492DRAFT_951733 [Pavlovales sp. CCMP2436]